MTTLDGDAASHRASIRRSHRRSTRHYYAVHHDHEHHLHHHHSHDHTHHQHDIERFFVVPRGVILEYGPYVYHGVCDFRVERLQGIQKQLVKMGARVKLLPCTDFVNHVQIWYLDSLIFKCKLTDLVHGGDGEMDNLCVEAARAFDHYSRKAIHGLRHRVELENQELVTPYTACMKSGMLGGSTVNLAEPPKKLDMDLNFEDPNAPAKTEEKKPSSPEAQESQAGESKTEEKNSDSTEGTKAARKERKDEEDIAENEAKASARAAAARAAGADADYDDMDEDDYDQAEDENIPPLVVT